jgi:NitT/TauT family transport system permease protein
MTQTLLSRPSRLAGSGANTKQLEPSTGAARDKAWRLVRRIALPAVILIGWQALTAGGLVSSASLPSPVAVAVAWWDWIFGPRQALAWYSGTWGSYVLMSLERVAAGFAIASAAGIVLGVLIGWYSTMEDLFDGLINFLRAVPMTAWVPFAVFVFGIHESAAIFLIAFGSFFPIVVNVAAGARQTPRILIRAARMLGTPPGNCCCAWCCRPLFRRSLLACEWDSAWHGSW